MTETFYNLLGIFLPQFLGLSWLHVSGNCAVESSMIYLSVVLLPDKIPHYSKQQTYIECKKKIINRFRVNKTLDKIDIKSYSHHRMLQLINEIASYNFWNFE